MAKKRIAVDIDEVLFPLTTEFLVKHNREHGTSIGLSDLHSYYYIEELYDIKNGDEAEDIIESFLQEAYEGNIGPYSGAVDAIKKLQEQFDIYVITARRPSMQAITEKWLTKHFPEVFKEVHFPRVQKPNVTKADICKAIGAEYLIDDHPDNLEGMHGSGAQMLLFGDYPWNADVPTTGNITRVKNWQEVLEYFDGKG